jgi:hypothetical protein
MDGKNRNLIGKQLVEKTTIKDIIRYFGSDDILYHIDDSDIADRIDECVLKMVDDDLLIECINNADNFLSSLDTAEIIEEIEDRGFYVRAIDDDNEPMLKRIKMLCREIQPNGYLDKEDLKRILIDYIDNYYTNSKNVN